MDVDKFGKKLPQLGRESSSRRLTYEPPGQINGTATWKWAIVSSGLLVLFLVVTMPVWVRWFRGIIPDRYIAAYAPEVVADWFFESNLPLNDLPSLQDVDHAAAAALIDVTPLPASPTPTVTPTPRLEPTVPVRPGAAPLRSNAPPTPTPTATAVPVAARSAVDGTGNADLSQAIELLTGFNHVRQGWNNCGPATMAVVMSYFDVELTQTQTASALKPNPEDRNVRPDEMQRYVSELGYGMIVRVNGDILTLQRLIDGGYPVVVEKGFEPEAQFDWAGHYLTLTGYTNDAFIAMDTYLGPNREYPFTALDTYWRQFNRTFLVAFPPGERAIVESIIGEMSEDEMWQAALQTTQAELAQNDQDAFGWFNLGTNFVQLGRYEEAAIAYDKALDLGLPGRMLWYQFGPYEAYYQVGRYEDVTILAEETLTRNPMSEEAHYYKGLVYEAQGSEDQAKGQFQQALILNKYYEAAQQQLDRLG